MKDTAISSAPTRCLIAIPKGNGGDVVVGWFKDPKNSVTMVVNGLYPYSPFSGELLEPAHKATASEELSRTVTAEQIKKDFISVGTCPECDTEFAAFGLTAQRLQAEGKFHCTICNTETETKIEDETALASLVASENQALAAYQEIAGSDSSSSDSEDEDDEAFDDDEDDKVEGRVRVVRASDDEDDEDGEGDEEDGCGDGRMAKGGDDSDYDDDDDTDDLEDDDDESTASAGGETVTDPKTKQGEPSAVTPAPVTEGVPAGSPSGTNPATPAAPVVAAPAAQASEAQPAVNPAATQAPPASDATPTQPVTTQPSAESLPKTGDTNTPAPTMNPEGTPPVPQSVTPESPAGAQGNMITVSAMEGVNLAEGNLSMSLVGGSDPQYFIFHNLKPVAKLVRSAAAPELRDDFANHKVFATAFQAAIKTGWNAEAQARFGFEPITFTLPVSDAVKQVIEAGMDEKRAEHDAVIAELRENFSQSMSIAFMQDIKGMNGVESNLVRALVARLEKSGVRAPAGLVHAAFAEAADSFIVTVTEKALELLDETPATRNALAKLVVAAKYQHAETASADTQEVRDRMEKGAIALAQPVEVTTDSPQAPKTEATASANPSSKVPGLSDFGATVYAMVGNKR